MKPASADAMGAALTKLIVLDGPDRGKTFELAAGRQYLVGRSEECDIRIDMSDKTVSRKHALLTPAGNTISIENLSQTNPVQVKGKPVKKTTLKHKGQFQIGAGLFAFESFGRPEAGAGATASPVNLKIVIPAALFLIVLLVFFIVVSGKDDESGPGDMDITRPAATSGHDMISSPDHAADRLPRAAGLAVSAEDKEKAEAHFREGMFFYDTGNIARAVDEWSRAIAIHPDHPEAQAWYLRAERELDEMVKTHYQNGMMHYKYMRYRDAVHEFGIVVELSRNKSGDHYINALRYLNELQGK